MSDCLLKVENLSKHFVFRKNSFSPKMIIEAVKDVSFEIIKGESLGLIGESGSGKSTTANLVLGLTEPSAGRVELFGRGIVQMPAEEMRRLRKDIQIIFQQSTGALDPKMTIEELLAEPLRIHCVVPRPEIDDEVNRLLDLVGLATGEREKYPSQMSGGQKQRVIIARAIATRPKLIVCDEPVSALDVSVQGQILNLLQSLKQELELTYLFISHDLAVVRHMCERIVVMQEGEIVEMGATDQVLANPTHEHTRRLLASQL